MEQINLKDNQKELKSGEGKDGEGDFFHHQWKKMGEWCEFQIKCVTLQL